MLWLIYFKFIQTKNKLIINAFLFPYLHIPMTKNLALTIAIGSCFASCQKRDPAPLSRTQLLADKKWYVESYVVTTPIASTQDIYPLIPSCRQDDFEQFILSGSFLYDEGLTKCNAADVQIQSGTWQLSTNDSQLTITFNSSTRIYIIAELTNKSLRLKSSERNAKGEITTYDISLVAK